MIEPHVVETLKQYMTPIKTDDLTWDNEALNKLPDLNPESQASLQAEINKKAEEINHSVGQEIVVARSRPMQFDFRKLSEISGRIEKKIEELKVSNLSTGAKNAIAHSASKEYDSLLSDFQTKGLDKFMTPMASLTTEELVKKVNNPNAPINDDGAFVVTCPRPGLINALPGLQENGKLNSEFLEGWTGTAKFGLVFTIKNGLIVDVKAL